MDCLNDIDGGYSASDVIFPNLWKISRLMEFLVVLKLATKLNQVRSCSLQSKELHHVDRRWRLNCNSLSINKSCHKALSKNRNSLNCSLIEGQINTFVWYVFNNLEKWLINFTDPYIIFKLTLLRAMNAHRAGAYLRSPWC